MRVRGEIVDVGHQVSQVEQMLANAATRMGAFQNFNVVSDGSSCVTAFATATEGLTVGLLRLDDYWIVTADDWFGSMRCYAAALTLVEEAMAGLVRLRVDVVDNLPWRWTIERLVPGPDWVAAGGSLQKAPPGFRGLRGTKKLQNVMMLAN
jgi:hypothetical protein